MSAEKKVITTKGEELPISQCRKFNKEYYKIGNIDIENSGECYLIDDKYYREETGLICFNHSVKKYTLKNESIILGVVNLVEETLIFGNFYHSNGLNIVVDSNMAQYYIFNDEIFKDSLSYRERLSNGLYYHITRFPSNKFNLISFPDKSYKYSLPYDSKGIIDNNLKNYNENYNPEILKNIKKYAPILGNLTFGLEFETTKGYIPTRILDKYGLIPLRDGSISGIEYVTVPMQGEKGLQAVVDIVDQLEKRTEYDDKTCSLHLHLGNVPRTKEFILAFFKVGMKIQDEMFKMFPLYKKYNYGIKNKNYSSPLPTFEILSQLDNIINSTNINHNFGVLYKYLSMGQEFKSVDNDINNIECHPADPNGNQKWNITPRYLIYNIIPLLFGNRQTIEFRIHTPTYDINKILPFIFMNAAIVNFTINYQSSILNNPLFLINNDLTNILTMYINDTSITDRSSFKNLMYHYISRRKIYCERQTLGGNILGTESEIPSDSDINWREKALKYKNKVSEDTYMSINQPSYGGIDSINWGELYQQLDSESKNKVDTLNGYDIPSGFYEKTEDQIINNL